MKILYKNGVKTICHNDHFDVDGYECIDIPAGYSITEFLIVDGLEKEVVKNIELIRAECFVTA